MVFKQAITQIVNVRVFERLLKPNIYRHSYIDRPSHSNITTKVIKNSQANLCTQGAVISYAINLI